MTLPAILQGLLKDSAGGGSKKLQAFVVFLLAMTAVAACGQINWAEWVEQAKWAFGFYVGSEGLQKGLTEIGSKRKA